VYVWDVASREQVCAPGSVHGWVEALSFNADGSLLAISAHQTHPAIMDLTTGGFIKENRDYPGGTFNEGLAFSPEGNDLAISSPRDSRVQLWEVETGRLEGELVGHSRRIGRIAYSPDGNLLASASHDGTVRLWAVQLGAPWLSLVLPHPAPVFSVAFSPDGRLLATGAAVDSEAWIWRVPAPPEELHEMEVRTWLALGARHGANRDVQTIGWEEWTGLREELDQLIRRRSVEGGSDGASVFAEESLDGDDDWFGRYRRGVRFINEGKRLDISMRDCADAFEKAFDSFEELAEEFPDTDAYRIMAGPAWRGVFNLIYHRVSTSPNPDELLTLARKAFDWQRRSPYAASFPGYDKWIVLGGAQWRAARWSEAITTLTRAIEALTEPGAGLSEQRERNYLRLALLLRGIAHVQLGGTEQAEADFAQAESLVGYIRFDIYRMALMQLASRNLPAWRRICAVMVDRFGQRFEDPGSRSWMAWICALAPDALHDLSPVVSLAEEARQQNDTVNARQALGAILYRAGQHKAAISQLSELDEQWHEMSSPTSGWNSTYERPYYVSFFLAMAHHQMGHPIEARKWLDKALQATAEEREFDEARWHHLGIVDFLRQEAESLLGLEDPPVPPAHVSIPTQGS
jgi:tetratricopeptide (TPR) repeat protein